MCETCGCSDNSSPGSINLQSGLTLTIGTANDHEHVHDHDTPIRARRPRHEHHHQHHDHGHSSWRSRQRACSFARGDGSSGNGRPRQEQPPGGAQSGLVRRPQYLRLEPDERPGRRQDDPARTHHQRPGRELTLSVIEGDQETINDAERIRATGCRVVQINTGTGCHLDAVMLAKGLQQLEPPMNSVVLIENVGNLVCPAPFDLGERSRVVIASVTEGDDKPIKYPHMFRQCDVMILNKIDLLPYVPFNVDRCLDYARQVNPHIRVIQVSALRGDGLDEWYDWIREQLTAASDSR